MLERYKTVYQGKSGEIIEKKSRFIATVRLVENEEEYLKPLILNLTDYKLYDLSDEKVSKKVHITDLMKTMDNRIAIDEATLKHFVADERIKATADKFRAKSKR